MSITSIKKSLIDFAKSLRHLVTLTCYPAYYQPFPENVLSSERQKCVKKHLLPFQRGKCTLTVYLEYLCKVAD